MWPLPCARQIDATYIRGSRLALSERLDKYVKRQQELSQLEPRNQATGLPAKWLDTLGGGLEVHDVPRDGNCIPSV